MKRDCDFSRIDAKHDAINLRLEEWARWVRVRPQPWKMQPMFRLYKAPPQWEPREIHIEPNTIECMEMEKAVYWLPEKHRTAIRWNYVYPNIHPGVIQRKLAVTIDGLSQLVNDGRDMLKNRLKQKLVDI